MNNSFIGMRDCSRLRRFGLDLNQIISVVLKQ